MPVLQRLTQMKARRGAMRLQRQNSGLQQSNEQFHQVTKARQLKGNQQLNEELQMKANELEELFAAHKLRVSGNHFISSRRTSPVDVQVEEEKQSIENMVELNPNMNIVEFGRLNSSKGKLYDRYMQKRDAKLREEWEWRRVQNEEKMKAMSDNIERIRALLKATSAGSLDQQESSLQAEKLRSFNKQQPIKPIQVQDEYVSDSSEQGRSRKDPSFNETFSGDDSTKNNKSKKLTHSRTFSAPVPRSSAPPIPRSASKGSNVGRRRVLPENPVGQSLPNFSEFKEQNRKHSEAVRKETTRLQFSHVPRSKSSNGQVPSTKKDNVGRSQSIKKSSASSNEQKDLSPPNSDGDNSTQFQKNSESKPFLKKGTGIGPGAGAGVAKLKAAMESENTNSEDESILMADKRRDSVSLIKETRIVVIPTDSDSEISRLRHESERSGIPGSDDIVILKLKSKVDPEMVSQVTTVPSTFHTPVRPVQDSPVQSPASWSSRMRSPFSYSHKGSDNDVSVESPMASPASWSSRSITNVETDSPRTRKKWSVAQKSFIANASDHQSNNVAKGIKRLLSFGRKTRGTEGMADCISSTTSEADDDTEDGHYLASKSSDDPRKSRMGFSQGHCSYEAEGGFVSKEVQAVHSSIPAPPENFKLKDHHLSGSLLAAPKSFFSLPSFRSKGSDLKHR